MIYTDEVDLVYLYLSEYLPCELLDRLKHRHKQMCSWHNVIFKSCAWYLGSANLPAEYVAKESIKLFDRHPNQGYTYTIGQALNIEAIKKEFPPLDCDNYIVKKMMNYSSRGPALYAKIGTEFTNVKRFDITSTYPALLMGEVPYKFSRKREPDSKGYYCKFVIKNLRAKHRNFTPIFIPHKLDNAAKREEFGICTNDGTNRQGKGVYLARHFEYYGYDFELEVLKAAYDFDSIITTDVFYVSYKRLPEESIAALRKAFEKKQEMKGTVYADAYKVLFNRCYGYFVTTAKGRYGRKIRDFEVPFQVGAYIQNRARYMMVDMAVNIVGLENVVAMHTDSIYVTENCNIDLTQYCIIPNEYRYKNIGYFKFEGTMSRCCYFGYTLAKYIQDGKLEMKHGGIHRSLAEKIVKHYSYDEIQPDLVIPDIAYKYLVQCSGHIYLRRDIRYRNLKQAIESARDRKEVNNHELEEFNQRSIAG